MRLGNWVSLLQLSINMQLANKKCVPCQGGEDPLTSEQIQNYLPATPGWTHVKQGKTDKLNRTLVLKDFMAVVDLINKIAEIAESEGHHPNLSLHDYKKLTIELYTHKIGGLHENDFIIAVKINNLLKDINHKSEKNSK